MVELEFAPEGTPAGQHGLSVVVEDCTTEPMLPLFREGIAAFMLRHRLTTFTARIEIVRLPGVPRETPMAALKESEVFRRVQVLEPDPTPEATVLEANTGEMVPW